jgi:hypothetical protein
VDWELLLAAGDGQAGEEVVHVEHIRCQRGNSAMLNSCVTYSHMPATRP